MLNLTTRYIAKILPERAKDANKGTFGKVLVIAGSKKFPGAAYLSCTAAYRVGAGLISLVTPDFVKIIVSRKLPEVIFLSQEEAYERSSSSSKKLSDYDVVLLGPGLGQKNESIKLVKQLLKDELPTAIIDGDGLNILSKIDEWWERIETKCVLTPHPGEMARLTGWTVDQIQSDRINVSQRFAKLWKKAVVLKGANTTIASPGEKIALSPFANPLLATAGTGDVLSGIIAGLIAQGLEPFDASCAAVYIHGMAGEIIRKSIGDAGILASDFAAATSKGFTQHNQTKDQLN